jgi:hypothetical protein
MHFNDYNNISAGYWLLKESSVPDRVSSLIGWFSLDTSINITRRDASLEPYELQSIFITNVACNIISVT